jgi:hypothetical protein
VPLQEVHPLTPLNRILGPHLLVEDNVHEQVPEGQRVDGIVGWSVAGDLHRQGPQLLLVDFVIQPPGVAVFEVRTLADPKGVTVSRDDQIVDSQDVGSGEAPLEEPDVDLSPEETEETAAQGVAILTDDASFDLFDACQLLYLALEPVRGSVDLAPVDAALPGWLRHSRHGGGGIGHRAGSAGGIVSSPAR